MYVHILLDFKIDLSGIAYDLKFKYDHPFALARKEAAVGKIER